MSTPILTIHNRHTAACGTPPALGAAASDLYVGYFENPFQEQWIFTFDRRTRTATLRGGDVGWETIHVVRDGRVAGPTLGRQEARPAPGVLAGRNGGKFPRAALMSAWPRRTSATTHSNPRRPFSSSAMKQGAIGARALIAAIPTMTAVPPGRTASRIWSVVASLPDLVIGGGVFLLGFAGSRWTQGFAERYLGYAVSVGVKLFVLYLIMGVGANIALGWGDLLLAAADNMTPAIYLEIIGGSLVFVLLAWTVPSTVSGLMVGAVSLSLADAVMPTTMGTRMATTAAGVTAATFASLGHRAADHWSATPAAQLHTTVWPRGGGPGSNGDAAPPSAPPQGSSPPESGPAAVPTAPSRRNAALPPDVTEPTTEAPAPSTAPGRAGDRDAEREPPTPPNQPLAW